MRHAGRSSRVRGIVRPLLAWGAGVACALSVLGTGRREPDDALAFISRPSDLRELGFSLRGTVREVKVKPGDAVKAGQELVRLNDAVQRAIADAAKIQAEDTTHLRLAQGNLAYREKELEELERAMKSGGGSESQLRETRFRVETARLDVEAARSRQRLAAAELARESARLDEMTIASPIDGMVLEVKKRAGETVDEGSPVLAVVAISPLWLEANVPARDAARVEVGQRAEVTFDDAPGEAPRGGTVIYKSPVGNAGARLVPIRVEVPNPTGLASGMHGRLRLAASGLPRRAE